MIRAIQEFIMENGFAAGIALVGAAVLIIFLIAVKVSNSKKKQRAIFSNSKNKYKSRLGKKNINKYIYKQSKRK